MSGASLKHTNEQLSRNTAMSARYQIQHTVTRILKANTKRRQQSARLYLDQTMANTTNITSLCCNSISTDHSLATTTYADTYFYKITTPRSIAPPLFFPLYFVLQPRSNLDNTVFIICFHRFCCPDAFGGSACFN